MEVHDIFSENVCNFIEGEGDGDIISYGNIMNLSLKKLKLVLQWETFLTTSEVFP